MAKVERREFHESRVSRTLSPGRHRSSTQNLAQFDSNLDNLLEDLQNSVSRPGSALGHSTNTYRETSRSVNALDTGRSSSLSRINNAKSSNPVTEYSSDDAYNYTSPDGSKHVSGYKKEAYSYKTSGGGTLPPERSTQSSINQLDSLLDDLQQVKQSSTFNESYNSTGTVPAYKEKKLMGREVVEREYHYADTPKTSRRTLEKTEHTSSLARDAQYSSEGNYGDIRQIRTISPTPSSRTSTLSKQTKVTNLHSSPVEVVETSAPDINPEILAHLDPHLRPPGNTKVTTTIKTYTYEIPGSGDFPTNLDSSLDTTEKYVYSPNQTITTPSKSFVYNKLENKSVENTVTNTYQPPYQKPPSPGHTVKEVITTRNYQPGYSPELHPPGSDTYFYNETTTTKTVDQNGYPQPPRKNTYIIKESHDTVTNVRDSPDYYPREPPSKEVYIHKEVHNTTNTNVQRPYPDDHDYPVQRPEPINKTYIYKKETHNTHTNRYPYPNGYPPNDVSTTIYKEEKHTTDNYHGRPPTPADTETFDPKHPPYPGRRPPENVNINYKYVSKDTSTSNYTGYVPDEKEPLLPRPFPTDNQAGPPKKLDELMATIGNEPPNSPLNQGFNQHEHEMMHQKKVDELKQQSSKDVEEVLIKKEPIPQTKNVSGPPVYYPPGEMFMQKEEASGAWRAQGAYAKESGKYKYEAESGAKQSQRSGAAVVPVCLPLCCGLPCVIL